MSDNIHQRGIRDYNTDTLQVIARDLAKNPLSYRKGTWEQGRLDAIRKDLKRRGRVSS